MKTTVEIPEKLFREAKARASMEGLTLREFFLRGLRLALQTPPPQPSSRRTSFPRIHSTQGKTHLTDEQVAAALNTDEDVR